MPVPELPILSVCLVKSDAAAKLVIRLGNSRKAWMTRYRPNPRTNMQAKSCRHPFGLWLWFDTFKIEEGA